MIVDRSYYYCRSTLIVLIILLASTVVCIIVLGSTHTEILELNGGKTTT